MENDILVLGHGPVGKATVELLLQQGRQVRVGQRKRPLDLQAGAIFIACDVLDAASVTKACASAAQVVIAIGLEYKAEVWRRDWPKAMANILAACEASGSRIVFVDNLYMYGPQDEPLREDTPLTEFGAKPAARATITRQWQAASAAGKVKFAALRAADFYGPGVLNSHLGSASLAAIAKGKTAQMFMSLNVPHDFAYVPDFARAVVTLLDAPDDAYGQAWHVPHAATRTPRQILELASQLAGKPPKMSQLPVWSLPLLAFFVPFVKELREMKFLLLRPYAVDASKFKQRFWSDATPFEVGIAKTMESFRPSPTHP